MIDLNSPTIEIGDSPINIQLIMISAIMPFPRQKENYLRNLWLAQELLFVAAEKQKQGKETAEEIGDWMGYMLTQVGGWPMLAEATRHNELSKKRINARYKRGVIIGWIFKNVLIRNVGIFQATEQFLNEDAPILEDLLSGRSDIPKNPRHIRDNLWPKYKDSAHLWGIYNHCGKAKGLTRWLPVDNLGLEDFVQASEEYLKIGLVRMPKAGRRQPLLSSDTAWRIKL